jgi:hydroxyacyl-ACP dehydratase HTD2-like protein with hotdog domain
MWFIFGLCPKMNHLLLLLVRAKRAQKSKAAIAVKNFISMQEAVISNEICSLSMVRRVAAMLDLDTKSFSNGGVLPRGWHFFMLAGETRKSALRSDGFPGLGVPIPDLGLPRLLLGGRTVSYKNDIVIGSEIERTSFFYST